jgi:hypothetical protein
MAGLGQTFDSSRHKDMNNGFDPLPKGDYVAMIKESDIVVTAKKTGKYIKLKFEVLAGEFKGRFFWNNLNTINPNAMTVEIAQKELATICRACGVGNLQDTNQLHGKPMVVTLKITPAKGDYPPGNSPTGYVAATKGGTSADPAGFENEDVPFGDEGAPKKEEIADDDGWDDD